MVFIRPVSMADVEPLAELAGLAGVGLTTLPKDRDLLTRRIQKSIRSFERIPDRPGGESYLFVMEDGETNQVIGASGIVSKVGGFEPFYAFQILTEVHASDVPNVRTQVPYLSLVRQHDGPCEIGSLFLHPAHRGRDRGRLLQLVRFLFLAEHPAAFEETVVSELRGVIDSNGHSPFWDAVGRHFFDIDFPQADHLSVVNKRFIADLMPVHPIYIPLLPGSAQKVIGQAHEASIPAQRNLEAEGFAFNGMVDIFDAGPCIACDRDSIRAVRESRCAVVREVTDEPISAPTFIVGTRNGEFRAAAGPVEPIKSGVRIERSLARALKLEPEAEVRYTPLRPSEQSADAGAGGRSEREGSD